MKVRCKEDGRYIIHPLVGDFRDSYTSLHSKRRPQSQSFDTPHNTNMSNEPKAYRLRSQQPSGKFDYGKLPVFDDEDEDLDFVDDDEEDDSDDDDEVEEEDDIMPDESRARSCPSHVRRIPTTVSSLEVLTLNGQARNIRQGAPSPEPLPTPNRASVEVDTASKKKQSKLLPTNVSVTRHWRQIF